MSRSLTFWPFRFTGCEPWCIVRLISVSNYVKSVVLLTLSVCLSRACLCLSVCSGSVFRDWSARRTADNDTDMYARDSTVYVHSQSLWPHYTGTLRLDARLYVCVFYVSVLILFICVFEFQSTALYWQISGSRWMTNLYRIVTAAPLCCICWSLCLC